MHILNEELLKIVEGFGLKPAGIEYVESALEKPSRRVGDHAPKNVSGQYFSGKQGLMIQTESHGKELPTLLRWEFDTDVYSYRCQPPSVEITRTNKNGKNIRHQYTPDFLVITNNRVFIVEVKSGSDLQRLKNKYPGQWVEIGDGSGSWNYQPASSVFEKMGLSYQVVNASLFNKIESANLKTLLRVRATDITVEQALVERSLSLLADNAWMTLESLRQALSLSGFGELLSLVERNTIKINLKRSLLTNPEGCLVALDIATLDTWEVEHERHLEPWQIADTKAWVPSKLNTDRAIEKLRYVESGIKDRKYRRLKAKITEGKKLGLTPLQSVIDGRKGNPERKRDNVIIEFLESNVESFIATPLRRSVGTAYSEYRVNAKLAHPAHKPVTFKTFKRALDRLD